jgi:hypothetical protein
VLCAAGQQLVEPLCEVTPYSADVVVRGPRLDEALGQLAGLLAADLADLDAVPVFFVQGLQLVEPLCE